MNINLDMLGHMSSHHPKTNTICRQLSSTNNQYSLSFGVAIDAIAFHPLSTFHTTIYLIGPDTNEKGCLQANITPEINAALRAALRYVPISVLFFVLFVGLELMTQIVGAPTTMGTWLNMVILIVAIAALSAICIEIFWLLNRPVGSDTGLRRTFNRTLHVVLFYFMLPLIALSCYQLDNASHLPSWHILLASVFILSIRRRPENFSF